jgi:hypothetical protein
MHGSDGLCGPEEPELSSKSQSAQSNGVQPQPKKLPRILLRKEEHRQPDLVAMKALCRSGISDRCDQGRQSKRKSHPTGSDYGSTDALKECEAKGGPRNHSATPFNLVEFSKLDLCLLCHLFTSTAVLLGCDSGAGFNIRIRRKHGQGCHSRTGTHWVGRKSDRIHLVQGSSAAVQNKLNLRQSASKNRKHRQRSGALLESDAGTTCLLLEKSLRRPLLCRRKLRW